MFVAHQVNNRQLLFFSFYLIPDGGNASSFEDNDNSLTSFEGIFNGTSEPLDLDAPVSSIVKENFLKTNENKSEIISRDKNSKTNESDNNTGISASLKSSGKDDLSLSKHANEKTMTSESCTKQTQSKSLMLADLLDKKEGPALNGVLGKDLRIGEKGLELVEKAILKETSLNHKGVTVKKDSVVNVNGDARTGGDHRSTVINNATSSQCRSKRSASTELDAIEEKRFKTETGSSKMKGILLTTLK